MFSYKMYGDKCHDLSGLQPWMLEVILISRKIKMEHSMLNFLWDYPVELEDEDAIITIGDQRFPFKKKDVEMYFFCVNYRDDMEFTDFYAIMAANRMSSLDYTFFKQPVEESGQAKILVGTLEGFVDCAQDQQVIVIGSASYKHVVGGRSYDTLARMLTNLGYRGNMDLYDPEEENSTLIVGNFVINKVAKEVISFHGMKMLSGRKPTVIFDDAYSQDYGVRVFPDIWKLKIGRSLMVPGVSKYVIVKDRGSYYLKGGLQSHSAHGEDENDNLIVVGGGYVDFNTVDRTFKFFGDSERYGQPSLPLVRSVMEGPQYEGTISSYYVGGGYRKHDPNRIVLSNDCRVSLKALPGESVPVGCCLRHQFFYSKRESRLVKGFPPVPATIIQLGDGCNACKHLGRVLSGIRSYSGAKAYEVFKLLFVAHVVRPCYAERGTRQASRIGLLREHLWKQVSKEYSQESYFESYPEDSEHDYDRLFKFVGGVTETRSFKAKASEFVGTHFQRNGKALRETIVKHNMSATRKVNKFAKGNGKRPTMIKFAEIIKGGKFALIKEGSEEKSSDWTVSVDSDANVKYIGSLEVGNPAHVPTDKDNWLVVPSTSDKYVNRSIWSHLASGFGYTVWKPDYVDYPGEVVRSDQFRYGASEFSFDKPPFDFQSSIPEDMIEDLVYTASCTIVSLEYGTIYIHLKHVSYLYDDEELRLPNSQVGIDKILALEYSHAKE